MHYTAVLVSLQTLWWVNISSDLLAWVFASPCISYFFFLACLYVCLCAYALCLPPPPPSPLPLFLSLSQTHYATLFPLFFLSHAMIVIAYGFRRGTLCPCLHIHGEQPRVGVSVLSAHSPGYPGIMSIKDSCWRKGGCVIWQFFLILISL